MKFRRNITIFIRRPGSQGIDWEIHKVKKALVTQTLEANSNISAKGFVPNSKIVVRFTPDSSFGLTPGDFIFIGETDSTSPTADCRCVLSVSGGDRGSRTLRLIKAVCG